MRAAQTRTTEACLRAECFCHYTHLTNIIVICALNSRKKSSYSWFMSMQRATELKSLSLNPKWQWLWRWAPANIHMDANSFLGNVTVNVILIKNHNFSEGLGSGFSRRAWTGIGFSPFLSLWLLQALFAQTQSCCSLPHFCFVFLQAPFRSVFISHIFLVYFFVSL